MPFDIHVRDQGVRVEIGPVTICLSPEDALDLAAKLVLEASGDLIARVDDGRIKEWNFNSRFFAAYRSNFEGTADARPR